MPIRRIPVRHIVGLVEGSSSRPLAVATDEGRFVLKLVGAPEGPRALAAEWITAELAAAIGLPGPERVGLDLDPRLASEVRLDEAREAVARGAGLCLGLRELPGARPARPNELASAPDEFAVRVLWLDVLVDNPDRRAQNPNVLAWQASLVPIDHGSALAFHHGWDVDEATPLRDLAPGPDHVFRDRVPQLAAWHGELAARLPRDALEAICASVPEEWLGSIVFETAERQRMAYAAYLWKRLRAIHARSP